MSKQETECSICDYIKKMRWTKTRAYYEFGSNGLPVEICGGTICDNCGETLDWLDENGPPLATH